MSFPEDKIKFNPWKHHMNFVIQEIKQTIREEPYPSYQNRIIDKLSEINSNYLDIYTGNLNLHEIASQVAYFLDDLGVFSRKELNKWLKEETYKLVSLSDQSNWIIKRSEDIEFIIHIHPSRIPPHSIRFHGNAWKTVIGLILQDPYSLHQFPDIAIINAFRKNKIRLSPVKTSDNLKRIYNVYEFIQPKINSLLANPRYLKL